MICIGEIRAHIDRLPEDAIVTTRDLLQYGFRNTIDKSLSRLVDTKVLARVARGVFIKYGSPEPSPLQAAIAKAKAFGKDLVTHGQEIAREFQLTDRAESPQLIYQVKGRSSSFLFLGRRIYLRGAVAKKMVGGETKVARVVRALSFLGRNLGRTQLHTAISHVDQAERHLLLESARWMSSWLADDLRRALVCRPRAKIRSRAMAS